MNITEFLEARIAEDEAGARTASPGPWKWEGDYPKGHCPHGTDWTDHGPDLVSSVKTNDKFDREFHAVIESSGYDASSLTITDDDAEFIAKHNPSRVLAECAAKRAIIESYVNITKAAGKKQPNVETALTLEGMREGTRMVLAALAFPYKDHPDYRQEWAL